MSQTVDGKIDSSCIKVITVCSYSYSEAYELHLVMQLTNIQLHSIQAYMQTTQFLETSQNASLSTVVYSYSSRTSRMPKHLTKGFDFLPS